MKKLLLLLLTIIFIQAKAQVIVSQPQNFIKYIIVKDSLIAQNTLLSTDSSHLVPTTEWVKRNNSSGVEYFLTNGYGILGNPFNGSSSVTFKIDTNHTNGIQTVGNFFTLGNTKYYTKTQADARYQLIGNYITGLTGDVTATGPGSVAATLSTVNTNTGSFGTASSVPSYTVNGKGLITASANTAIQITESQVTNLTSDLSGKQATLVSGTNIKTVNSTTLLGSGNLAITPSNTDTTTTGFATRLLINNYLTKALAASTYAPQTIGSSILYGNGSGGFSNVTIGSGVVFSGGTLSATDTGGTVTSVSSGSLSPLFTTGVANSTSTPALSFTLSNALAGTIFGNTSGSTAAPNYYSAQSFSDLILNVSSNGFVKRTGINAYSIDNSTYLTTSSAASTYQPIITFGTGVQTALGVNIGSAGAPVLFNGAGGTPSSMTATNLTGTASGLNIGGNAATATNALQWDGGATSLVAATGRISLGLGTLATQNGTFSGTSSGTNTGDQTITLTGEATGSGTGSFATVLTNSAVIGKVLTGYTSGAGTVSATDNILQAIQKLNGNISAITVPTAANPTATASFTAVNGSASTFMRSDAAPKIDTSHTSTGVATWSNLNNYATKAGLSATSPIFYNSATGVISSQAASASANGYVTNGSQTLAGNKLLTGTLFIGSSGSPAGEFAVQSTDAGTFTGGLSAWSGAYSVFGPNSNSTSGAALGFGYSTTSDQSMLLSVAPGVAWKPLVIGAASVNIWTNGHNNFSIDGSGNTIIAGTITNTGLTGGSAGNFVVNGGSGLFVTRTASQVLSDIGAAPATGGAYLPLTGGTVTGPTIFGEIANISTNNSIYAATNHFQYIQGGSSGLALSADGNRNTIIYARTTNNIDFLTNGIEALNINSSQTATFTGNVIAPNIASTSSGTWTPASATVTLSVAYTYYQTVGNMTTAFFYVSFPTSVNASQVAITGLPGSVYNYYPLNISINTSGSAIEGETATTNGTVLLSNATTHAAVTYAQMSGATLAGSVTYRSN